MRILSLFKPTGCLFAGEPGTRQAHQISLYWKSNQIFHYARFITPKRLTRRRGLYSRRCTRATSLNKAPFEEMSQYLRAVGNSVPALADPRFEFQISRSSRDECVTTRPNLLFVLVLTILR